MTWTFERMDEDDTRILATSDHGLVAWGNTLEDAQQNAARCEAAAIDVLCETGDLEAWLAHGGNPRLGTP
jgi:ribulose-5-phosphate 4-epimerase/fuculose-1-phosphate aldolase